MSKRPSLGSSSAFRFVFTMGIVNLWADVTYEGGGSIGGPFMGSLGASAAAIGIAAGIGEFLGYALRLPAGYVSDRTGKAWLLTFIGYAINMLAVPAMALAGNWETAAVLVVAERVGRAIRKPTVESMLSYTTGELGKGWVYGLNTALDEIGATIGPLIVGVVLYMKGGYRMGFGVLVVSSVLALATLSVARVMFPLPEKLEARRVPKGKEFTPAFWLYMVAGALLAAGLMSFELISYHLSRTGVVEGYWIPMFLAIATGIGVIVSLVAGRMFDRVGLPVILVTVSTSALFAPLVFFGGFWGALGGLVLWGVGYATQDTLLKALVAGMLPEGKRNLAFGMYYAGYGVGWLAGSVVTGLLYERSVMGVVVFCVAAQAASLPVFVIARRLERGGEGGRKGA